MEGKSDYGKKDIFLTLGLLIFILTIILMVYTNVFLRFYEVCHDSVNNLLATLIQIEVVILTVLISLSIAIIQLTVTSYSSRVAKIYQRDKWLLSITIIYILIIIASLTYLKTSKISNQNDKMIIILYGLGIFYLGIIPIYIYRLYEILKPEKIIDRVSKEIILKNILFEDSDCVLLMIDFLRGSFIKHDYESIERGLEKTRDRFKKAISKVSDEKKLLGVTKKIFKGLQSYCKFLLIQKDSEMILKTLKTFKKSAEFILNNEEVQGNLTDENIDEAGKMIIEIFMSIANLAIRKKNEETIDKLNYYFEKLGKISIQKSLGNTLKEILLGYEEIWKQTRKKELCDLSESEISYITKLAELTIENQNFGLLKNISFYLENIAKYSIDNDYNDDLEKSISSYKKIINLAVWRSGE